MQTTNLVVQEHLKHRGSRTSGSEGLPLVRTNGIKGIDASFPFLVNSGQDVVRVIREETPKIEVATF